MANISPASSRLLALLMSTVLAPAGVQAMQEPTVSGTLTGNGETIELPHVYVYAEAKGFYDESDPTWRVIFAAEPIDERDLDDFFITSPHVKVGITLTAEFGDERALGVFSQDIRLPGDGGSISGGSYPEIQIETAGPDRFAGRVHHAEPQQSFDNTYQYAFSFDAPLSDPNAPIGDPLPADGGAPGKAYVAWVEAVQARDLERLKTLVPPEMAEMLDAEDAMESLDMMRELTPTEVEILGGSSDGATAVLQVKGLMAGEKVNGEITLEKNGDLWIATNAAWH